MKELVNPVVTRKIAGLARLRLEESEIAAYTQELEKILGFVAQLAEVDVSGVEPTVHGIPVETRYREDEPVALSEEETRRIVACSEQALYEQYRVPQVIGGE